MGLCIRLQILRHNVRWRDSSCSLARFPSLAFFAACAVFKEMAEWFRSGQKAGNEDVRGDAHLIVSSNCVKEQEHRKRKVQPA